MQKINMKLICLGGLLLSIHLMILFASKFVVWEEMVLFVWLISQGLAPYRDISLVYPPGLFILFQGFFGVFGYSIQSLKILGYLLILFSDTVLMSVSWKLFRSYRAVIGVFIFYLLWLPLFEGQIVWFETLCTPFLLLSFYFFVRFIEGRRIALLTSGLFMGITLFIKQTFIWVFLIELLMIFCVPSKTWKTKLWNSVVFLAFPLSIQISCMSWFGYTGLIREYVYGVLIFPLTSLSQNQDFILAPSRYLIRQLYPAYFFSAVFFSITAFVKRSRISILILLFWVFFVFTSALPAWPRFGNFHLQSSLAILTLGVGYGIRSMKYVYKHIRIYGLTVLGMIIALGLTYQSQSHYYRDLYPRIEAYDEKSADHIVTFVRESIGDSVFFSFEKYRLYYFLLRQKPPVLPWMSLETSVTDKSMHAKIIQSIEAQKIPYIIYSQPGDNSYIDDKYLSHEWKDYLNVHYHEYVRDAGFSNTRILRRNETL